MLVACIPYTICRRPLLTTHKCGVARKRVLRDHPMSSTKLIMLRIKTRDADGIFPPTRGLRALDEFAKTDRSISIVAETGPIPNWRNSRLNPKSANF